MTQPAGAPAAGEAPRGSRLSRRLRAAGLLLGLAVVASSGWWGRNALSALEFFRVHSVEIVGTRYVAPSDVLARLSVDTVSSVWQDLARLEKRVRSHPQVASVDITRRLPGTLIVRITETPPVALVPTGGALRAVDSSGRTLPLDPSTVAIDLPIVPQRDTVVLRLLADVRARDTVLFGRISEARRTGTNEIVLLLATLTVRAGADLSAARLADIHLVEADLARRGARVTELDFRYRDQVIARVQ